VRFKGIFERVKMLFNNTKYYTPAEIIRDFIKRNILLFLITISFFIIGFDLTTEMAEANNEIEFYAAILINSTNPSKPLEIPSIINTETPFIILNFRENTKLHYSELSETFQSRPPPLV
jgi:hypothetical protein